VLTAYLAHYNTARPRPSLDLGVPEPVSTPAAESPPQIERVDVLGGLIHEYRRAA
jgi:hypothetical protein